MSNILKMEKQIQVISALAEGNSIRSIERMTGIHQDTIMRLGVRIGEGCARLIDQKMRDLPCKDLQLDEIWGFVGKKQKNASEEDEQKGLGDAWTYVAIDAATKAVPCFTVGKRNAATTRDFIANLSGRLKNRPQLSTDGLKFYADAIDAAFGGDVDYGKIVKTYANEATGNTRRYSPSELVHVEKERVTGNPDMTLVSTSYVERQNLTMRMHMRRLTRLTNAFSKKLENFKAAVALHFGYYNFVKMHQSLKATPAMALGVTTSLWTVADLIEQAR